MSRVVFESKLPKLPGVLKKEAKKRLAKAGNTVRNTLLDEVLVGERDGRTYRIPGTNRTYQASRPGQAPASRLGGLTQSYGVDLSELENLKVTVGSGLEIAAFLEFGTRSMAPRPHLMVAFNKARPEVERLLKEVWLEKVEK